MGAMLGCLDGLDMALLKLPYNRFVKRSALKLPLTLVIFSGVVVVGVIYQFLNISFNAVLNISRGVIVVGLITTFVLSARNRAR